MRPEGVPPVTGGSNYRPSRSVVHACVQTAWADEREDLTTDEAAVLISHIQDLCEESHVSDVYSRILELRDEILREEATLVEYVRSLIRSPKREPKDLR